MLRLILPALLLLSSAIACQSSVVASGPSPASLAIPAASTMTPCKGTYCGFLGSGDERARRAYELENPPFQYKN